MAAGPLAGCSTTQQEAARLQLNSARIRASENAVRVTRSDPDVSVGSVVLIRGQAQSAILVVIRNATSTPLSDLTISVGLRAGARGPRYVNAIAGLTYFGAHLPAIPAGGVLRWVFVTSSRIPPRASAFARVGSPPAWASMPAVLPTVSAAPVRTLPAGPHASELTVRVSNTSGMPQYQLPVYAYARRGARYLAAGSTIIAQLASGASTTLRLRLVGAVGSGSIGVQITPTIFQ